ncbi:ABC transporter ATP-binding protein/permease [Paenibacillus alvei]|uniref:ABC transporter ATP-binding protein/permease n=2 Tax=Paenibacillus TaxID=44249 RepID=A0ABT4GT92_PAEAL|nr:MULTISPECIES: ABC transporter ATP-binding protein [Paenibacillus]EJW18224.1 putative ABC transporter ATP-binding protein YknU [Paenibacillus alvei DSM 29]MCY9543745.1 ABC transporter ATP-binding protein/permease [Paenibacillus alvei]MCY9703709.1 ABC transporter ATP-binding protein/permease [Paenibacillus alvei]MCY9732588.1 ABC transporter ATP-binding protein/permease [Paenibacillus alvei]MCY9754353.1 ABC transporter ATP-binding protein/permease [Paenibacillus alvei]
MNVFKRLSTYYWPKKGYLIASIICLMAATALGLVYPNLLRILIDDVIAKERFDWVPWLALTVVVVVSIKGTLTFLHGFFGGRLGNYVAYEMRNACYRKLQFLSFRYYDKARTGDLMSRLTADLEGIRNFIGFGFAQILNMVLMVIFGAAMMFSIDWKLTLTTLIPIPLLILVALRFESKIHPAFREMRVAFSRLTTAVQENITGVRTVKSFARESHEVDKFSVRSEAYKENQIHAATLWGRYFPIMELLACCCVAMLLAVGGTKVINKELSLGELVAFFSMIWYIIGPMWGIGFHINNYTQSKASGERVLELLDTPVDVANNERAMVLKDDEVKGHVQFKDVSFRYEGDVNALSHISLDATPGKVIGLLGGTGAGKTTIIQLLMRAYDVKSGSITLDGHDIRDLDVKSLRSQMATVFQETFLFSSSIYNNIAYGRDDVTEEEVIRAAKLAQAHDFIMELPLGYDTIVGERGMGLSGGQKQRIAIARALLKDPKILILDDATSAVDMDTEHAIQAGFQEVMRGRTVFIIAHRISSLRHADEILVLEQGHIAQRGTHEQLIVVPGTYQDVYRIQYADKLDSDLTGNSTKDSTMSREQVRV